jgi:putative transposase
VRYLRERFAISERRACGLVGISRTAMRYQRRLRDDAALGQRLRELARERNRFGYRRLHVLLRREGLVVNLKRVYRLYRTEQLALRRRKRRRAAGLPRGPLLPVTQPNERWSIDFVSDVLAWGRRFRLLTVVDTFTRESLAIEIDTSLPGERVVRVLDRVAAQRGAPREIVMDNGPELTGRVLDQWAYGRGVRLRFIDPGKPVQNAHIESFHSRLRDECLNEHWFTSLADARRIVEAWRVDYNQGRPHSALGYRTPDEFHRAQAQIATQPEPARLS